MKYLKAVLCILISCALIFTVVFEIREQDHDCSGEECAVCAVLDICPGTDSGKMLCSGNYGVFEIEPPEAVVDALSVFTIDLFRISPVAEKVRLNN